MANNTTTFPTLAETILPQSKGGHNLMRQAVLIILGSLFVAVAAQISFRLPGATVPFTGQTFAVLMVGMVFGARLGALTLIAYCLEGFFLPVFAEARMWLSPPSIYTAGYLVGFIGAAYVTGWMAERGFDRNVLTTALAMLVGNIVIYVFGVLWLGFMLSSFENAIISGFTPFIIGDLAKLGLASLLMPLIWHGVQKRD